MLSAINKTQPGNTIVCFGGFQGRVAIILQWKFREGISEEVMLKLKLNDRKGPFMQRFLRIGRGKYEYKDISL